MHSAFIKKLILLTLLLLPMVQTWAGVSVTPAFVRMDKAVQEVEYIVPVMVSNTSAGKTEYFNAFVETREAQVNGIAATTVLEWTTVTPSNFTLEPGQVKKVNFKVRVPKGYVGDYRVFLAIMQDPKKYRSYIDKSKLQQSIGSMQFGKTSSQVGEYKTQVNSFIKINVPIVLRAITEGQAIKLNFKKINYGKFKVIATDTGKGVMSINMPVSNLSKFDIAISGSCEVYDAKGKKKLKVVTIRNKSVTIQPKTSADIECIFKSPLPVASYLIRGDFLLGIKGKNNRRSKKQAGMISIDADLAAKMAGRGASGVTNDRPVTPIMLAPSILEQTFRSGNIRPVTVEVINPTSNILSLSARFKSSNKNKVKAAISPKNFKLVPGGKKKIKLNLSASNKKSPVFGWLSFTAKQTAGSIPASIPVMMVPDKLKLKQRLRLVNTKATLSSDESRVNFTSILQNSNKGMPALYLNAKLKIRELVSGKEVSSVIGVLSNTSILPGGKIRINGIVNFNKLVNGVYKLIINLGSEQVGVKLEKTLRIIINRDAEEKIKVVE
mgnify:CR=1 FL=1